MPELPCRDCSTGGYGERSPNWCRVLGRVINTTKDIPMYDDIIPGLKPEIGCMGFKKKEV
jgi:hypothetical protein